MYKWCTMLDIISELFAKDLIVKGTNRQPSSCTRHTEPTTKLPLAIRTSWSCLVHIFRDLSDPYLPSVLLCPSRDYMSLHRLLVCIKATLSFTINRLATGFLATWTWEATFWMRWRNHSLQLWLQYFQGFQMYRGSKFPFSHWLFWSSLQQCCWTSQCKFNWPFINVLLVLPHPMAMQLVPAAAGIVGMQTGCR